MDLVHCSTGASKGEHVLVDAESEASTGDATQAAAYLTEIKMVRMGAPLSPTVYLFARNQDGDLWAYLMFSPSVPDEGTARLAVRFGRVPLQLVARDSVSQSTPLAQSNKQKYKANVLAQSAKMSTASTRLGPLKM